MSLERVIVHALAVIGLIFLVSSCQHAWVHYSNTPLKDEDGEVDYKRTMAYTATWRNSCPMQVE